MKTRFVVLTVLALSLASAFSQTADLASRSKALNDLFAQIWEDHVSHSPEFASTIGDYRFNDQLSDYSVDAYNRGHIARLGKRFNVSPAVFFDQASAIPLRRNIKRKTAKKKSVRPKTK